MKGKKLPPKCFNFFYSNAHDLDFQVCDFFFDVIERLISDPKEILNELGFSEIDESNDFSKEYFFFQSAKEYKGIDFIKGSDTNKLYIKTDGNMENEMEKSKCFRVNEDDLDPEKEETFVIEDFDLANEKNYKTDFDFFEEAKNNKVYEISDEDGFIPLHASYFWKPKTKYIIIPKDATLTFSIREYENIANHHVCDLIISKKSKNSAFNDSRTQFTNFRKTCVFLQKKGYKVQNNETDLMCAVLLFSKNGIEQTMRKSMLPVIIMINEKLKGNIEKNIMNILEKLDPETIYSTGNPTIIYHMLVKN